MKGQSAIEYLATYGWMLLVVAIVGGSIFTTVQDSSRIQSTSGLANADVQIENFGVTSNGLETEIRAATAEQVENVNLSLIDRDTGEVVYSSEEATIPVGYTETVSFPDVGRSEDTNTYGVEINYDKGGLEGLTVEGTITGRLTINGTVPEDDSITGSQLRANFTYNPSDPLEGETITFNGTNSDGSISSYEWDWTSDGNYEAMGDVTHNNYTDKGEYSAKLRVKDGSGTIDTETITVGVSNWTSTIDGFEDNNIDEYQVKSGSGTGKDLFDLVSSPSYNGTALYMNYNGGGENSALWSLQGEGLENYPDAGENWSTRLRWADGDRHSTIVKIMFGVKNSTTDTGWPNEYYYVKVRGSGNDKLSLGENFGSSTLLDEQGFNPDGYESEWNRLNLTWQENGYIQARLYDSSGTEIAKVSGTDDNVSGGGYGYGFSPNSNSDRSVYVDHNILN